MCGCLCIVFCLQQLVNGKMTVSRIKIGHLGVQSNVSIPFNLLHHYCFILVFKDQYFVSLRAQLLHQIIDKWCIFPLTTVTRDLCANVFGKTLHLLAHCDDIILENLNTSLYIILYDSKMMKSMLNLFKQPFNLES